MLEELGGKFVEQMHAMLRGAYPDRSDLRARAAFLVAIVQGAFDHAVASAPAWLHEKWFLDDLSDVAVGYVRALATA